jgi:hypothetical protein
MHTAACRHATLRGRLGTSSEGAETRAEPCLLPFPPLPSFPRSYLLAQDTKLTRFFKSWECQKHNTTAEQDACWNAGRSWPGDAAADFLASPEGADFATDREPEYLYYTQHAGGYMRKN